jgi:hypothetical protein
MGRPTKFNAALGRKILERLCREPITKVFADPSLPSRQTFYNWLLNDPAFFDDSTRARAIAALRELDEAEDWMSKAEDKDAGEVNVSLLRERLQHCRWKVSKLLPKTYGERVTATIGTYELRDCTDEQLERIAAGEDPAKVLSR